jgi:hypothetical protein
MAGEEQDYQARGLWGIAQLESPVDSGVPRDWNVDFDDNLTLVDRAIAL